MPPGEEKGKISRRLTMLHDQDGVGQFGGKLGEKRASAVRNYIVHKH